MSECLCGREICTYDPDTGCGLNAEINDSGSVLSAIKAWQRAIDASKQIDLMPPSDDGCAYFYLNGVKQRAWPVSIGNRFEINETINYLIPTVVFNYEPIGEAATVKESNDKADAG